VAGGVPVTAAPVIWIEPHHEEWPKEFARIAQTIRAALGERALRIDHIGSTAVAGLDAKDVIDVQVTVTHLLDAAPLRTAGFAESVGFQDHRPPGADGPDEDWSKRFFTQPDGMRRVNVHVRARGRPNQRYALLFRDFLRAKPRAAEAYARLKHGLAGVLHDSGTYADVKDHAVDLIVIAAEDWAAATGWQPGPSDG
jgi:GrpB-like predicted nucleotidyltransferase (UPF0157 family)